MIIGFVILAHQHPRQLLRLVRALNDLYGDPPIACHFDVHQAPFDRSIFPANVAFVQPSIRTGWAKWSVVAATLAALDLLRKMEDVDWAVHLSGADYPIAKAASVIADLAATNADALLDFREVGMDQSEAEAAFGPINPTLVQFEAPKNVRVRRAHYRAARYWLPAIRYEQSGARLGRQTHYFPFDSLWSPFSTEFKCYYGDHWFSADRKAIDILLHPTSQHLVLQRYLKFRFCPEECYYQSVLCNEPGLTVARNNRRYAQWHGGGAHPAYLGVDDLPDMMASGAHFARKFHADAPVLDAIDAALSIG